MSVLPGFPSPRQKHAERGTPNLLGQHRWDLLPLITNAWDRKALPNKPFAGSRKRSSPERARSNLDEGGSYVSIHDPMDYATSFAPITGSSRIARSISGKRRACLRKYRARVCNANPANHINSSPFPKDNLGQGPDSVCAKTRTRGWMPSRSFGHSSKLLKAPCSPRQFRLITTPGHRKLATSSTTKNAGLRPPTSSSKRASASWTPITAPRFLLDDSILTIVSRTVRRPHSSPPSSFVFVFRDNVATLRVIVHFHQLLPSNPLCPLDHRTKVHH